MRVTLSESIEYYKHNSPKGEYVLVLEGKSENEILAEQQLKWEEISIEDHIKKYINEGMNKKDAIKKVAKDRNLSKSEVYKFSLDI